MTMLSDDEIYAMYNEPRSDAEMLEFARELITAHTAKLLANVEMPEPVAFSHECELDYINNHAGRAGEILPFKHNPDLLNDDEFLHIYTKDQLQAYAAAAAAQARENALDEAKQACLQKHANGNWKNDTREECADAIEKLKESK